MSEPSRTDFDSSVFLFGGGGEFILSRQEWRKTLVLAIGSGWVPAGTVLELYFASIEIPSPGDAWERVRTWDGSYTRPEMQTVAVADAFAMGGALALAGTVDPELVEFLCWDSFQIGGSS